MKDLKKYTNYCQLVSEIEAKEARLKEISKERSSLLYEVESLKSDLEEYEEFLEMSKKDLNAIVRLRVKQCFNSAATYSDGGSLKSAPLSIFKKSKEYKDELTKSEKNLFKKIEPNVKRTQFSLRNAIRVAEEADPDFDVQESPIIEDYVDETVKEMSEYNQLSTSDIQEIKEIMYKFVEQVSKL